jgi:HAD superfamily hydrolase (TIGR01509 family)
MTLRALLFDVDGTLAETERDGHRVAFNRAFAEAGLPIVWDEGVYGELLRISGGKERIAYYVARAAPEVRLSWEEIGRLHRRKNEIFASLVPHLALRPGVRRLLQEARAAGLKLAIATTTSPENVTALLDAHGLVGFFDLVAAGDVVSRKKPAPDIYELVLRELRLAPEEAVAFEDSQNGLLAARATGIEAIVTPSSYTRQESFPGALAVLEHLGEPGRPARVLTGPDSGPVVVTLPWIADQLLRRRVRVG